MDLPVLVLVVLDSKQSVIYSDLYCFLSSESSDTKIISFHTWKNTRNLSHKTNLATGGVSPDQVFRMLQSPMLVKEETFIGARMTVSDN